MHIVILDNFRIARTILSIFAVLGLCAGCNPASSDAGFHSGRAALSNGEFQQAEMLLGRFADDNPHSQLCSRAFFLRGKAQIGLNNYGQATRIFRETIRRFGNTEEAHKSRYKLGMLHLLQGDSDAAITAFQEVIDRSPGTLVPEAEAMVRMLKQDVTAEQRRDETED